MDSAAAATAAKSLQSCPTLWNPIDGSPPGSPHPWDSPGKNTRVDCHFLLQCMKVKVKLLSCVRLLVTPWTAAHQAPSSTGFSRQEYWSGVPLPLINHCSIPLSEFLHLFSIFHSCKYHPAFYYYCFKLLCFNIIKFYAILKRQYKYLRT